MTRRPQAGPASDAQPVGQPLGPPPVPPADIARGAMASFAAERDGLLSDAPPESLLPPSEEAFTARDPFSADYADFLMAKVDIREARAPRVDTGLRADLVARPYLMERPEEGGHRGAAAVWRSLRGQLAEEAPDLPDASGPEELRLLRREVEAQKMLVDGVARGLDALLRRIDQRLEGADGDAGGPPRPSPLRPPARPAEA